VRKSDLRLPKRRRREEGRRRGREERSLIIDLKRHTQLAVAWNRHGSLVPRWT
jgi:hypothetical protein